MLFQAPVHVPVAHLNLAACRALQEEEWETLAAIFGEEIGSISADRTSFQVVLNLMETDQSDDEKISLWFW